MSSQVNKVKVVLIKDEVKKQVTIEVHEPDKDVDNGDAFCVVVVDGLLKSSKKIYGIDAQQAKDLATEFLTALLSEYKVQSENGSPIDIEDTFG